MDNDVHVGSKGWLYLVGGNNSLLDYYTVPGSFTSSLISEWDSLLRMRCSYFKQREISYLHIFVPNKLTIYPEYFRGELKNFSAHPINAFFNGVLLNENCTYLQAVVNSLPYFNRQKEKHQLYWKTDTHWTFHGCYCAYELICSKLGITANSELLHRPFVEGLLALDLGAKLNPPVKEEARFYEIIKNAERIYANELVIYKEANQLLNEISLHIGSNVVYRNESSSNNKKVVLFGDSYSEYRPHLLTGMLAETFEEVHFIWSTSIDFEYVRKIKPDIVITEIVERFMPTVPIDDFDLEQYVGEKLGTLKL